MGLGSFFKNLFGSAQETVDSGAQKIEHKLDTAKDTVDDLAGKAKDKLDDAKDAVQTTADKVNEKARQQHGTYFVVAGQRQGFYR